LETAVFQGEASTAIGALDAIEQELGVSLWLIDARIVTLQRYRGLEVQKEYAAIHSSAPGTFPGFIAY
jgi:hypothetical protein